MGQVITYEETLSSDDVSRLLAQVESRRGMILAAGLLLLATGIALGLVILGLEAPAELEGALLLVGAVVAVTGSMLAVTASEGRHRAIAIPRAPIRVTPDQLLIMDKVQFRIDEIVRAWVHEPSEAAGENLEYYLVFRKDERETGRAGVVVIAARWIANRSRFEESLQSFCSLEKTSKALRELGSFRLLFALT